MKCSGKRGRCSSFRQGSTWSIWNAEFGKKRRKPMAFKTLQTKREAISLDALGEEIAARRRAVGKIEVPRNVGTRRTASKRVLLDKIAQAGGDW